MEYLAVVWFFGQGPIAAALVVGLFWAALAHPERVRSPLKFRLSVLLLGGAVVLGVLIPLVLISLNADRSQRGKLDAELYLCVIPSVLLTFAIYLGVDAVLPVKKVRPSTDQASEP